MKQTDIDRLKAFCEKEGFQVRTRVMDKSVFEITVKDPWEGVEFIRGNGTNTIRKVVNYDGKLFSYFLRDSGNEGRIYTLHKSNFKPSTEAEYVEQLKREAFERYGEIKDGDRFQFENEEIKAIKLSDTPEFDYSKEADELSMWGFYLYSFGKWAKKLPERVEVHFSNVSVGSSGYRYEFINSKFKAVNHNKVGIFLASQLEKYLNNEINE